MNECVIGSMRSGSGSERHAAAARRCHVAGSADGDRHQRDDPVADDAGIPLPPQPPQSEVTNYQFFN